MKNQKFLSRTLFLLASVLFLGTNINLLAQTNGLRHVSREYSVISLFTNNPAAMYYITNLLNEPMPDLAVPEVSQTNSGPTGTYWTLKNTPVPLPFDPFPTLPFYEIGTNQQYLIDDRSVDYAALGAQQQAENEAAGLTNQTVTAVNIDTNGLWIQVPTNSLATPLYFNVNVMNTIQGQPYDILTKASLLAPAWATELTATGAAGNVTSASMPMNGRTNLFVWARTSVNYSFYLVGEPLSQDVFDGDAVTFSVETGGNPNLTFQWTFNGAAISGATSSTYTIYNVQDSDAGYYACLISDGTNSLVTAAAQLTTEGYSGDSLVMPVVSSRQNYVFKSGLTYYIGSPIQLYGNTVIEAGAVLKFDFDNSTNSSLLVMGGLTCKTEPYNPAILTSIDDDSAGEWIYFSTGSPQTYLTGVPYLDLTSATSNSLSNLRFLFADWGATTPVNNPRLDVWDCQFVDCDYGVVNLVAGSSTDSLHNVLFADCEAGVGASTNSITVQGEQVTADVGDFCLASGTPDLIALTNSIVWGNPLSAATVSTVDVAMNPDHRNFRHAGEGHYYLAADSPLHGAGTANISPRLQAELRNKTTYPPVTIAAYTQITGQITLSPQAPRYTNGAPDLGYFYDALDYTVATLYLTGGHLTVLPGTAIGIRNQYVSSEGYSTYYGFKVSQGGTVTSHGTPDKPVVFTAADLVQERPNLNYAGELVGIAYADNEWLPGITMFATDFEPGDPAAPTLDFRFSNFYVTESDQHFCSGLSYDGFWIFSASSCVNLNLQDCRLHNGLVNLGQPDYVDFPQDQVFGGSTVTWNNTLFENVSINLDPTFYEDDVDDLGLNVDLSFSARNNLFKGGQWLHLEPVPASAGNWVFKDNLFDQVNVIQDAGQPLDYDYNGYWPLSVDSMAWYAMINTWYWLPNTNYLQATTTLDGFTDGDNEQFLATAPPYQNSTFGDYYLPDTTPLYGAGSDTATNLGLYHYTTRIDQVKEGDDASKTMANIGLHYLAASNSVPVDTDGDGIPDYVENSHGDGNYGAHVGVETDWQNPMTDGVNPDPSNSVYLDIDLSGDGLVGRIKAALGMNPLDPGNPITLTKIITGQEPDIVTFAIPVNYNALTNFGGLNLNLDGADVTLSDIIPTTNGNSLIEWNTTYDPPGQHYLQPQMTLFSSDGDAGIFAGAGTLLPFNSTNVLQFYESDSMFDGNGAYLDAQLPEPDANYTIQLFDPCTTPPTFIKGITNSTSDGTIQETWDLTYDDGVTLFTGDTVNAVFNVTLLDPAQGTHTKVLHKLSSNEQGNGFDMVYVYTPTNGSLAYDYGNQDGTIWTGMQNVADTLLMPVTADGGHDDHYDSDFNIYTSQNFAGQVGYPGYITSQAGDNHSILGGLFPSLTNGVTKNFYCYAHGATNRIGNYAGDVAIDTYGISYILKNHYSTKGGLNTKNPYRFVFLDGCSTAKSKDWRRAFGIYPLDAPNQAARNSVGPQAFVGWDEDHTAWMNGSDGSDATLDVAFAYTETLASFYENWMDGATLAECIQAASTPAPDIAAFPVPQNGKVEYFRGMDADGSDYYVVNTNVLTSKISVVGHSGLKRTFYDNTQDGLYP